MTAKFAKMKLILLFVIIRCAESRRIQDPKFRSDYIFLAPFEDSWVKFHREPLPWHMARRVCEYEGSRLVTPMNSQNASYLKEVQSVFNVNEMYTGAHSTFGLGEFYTVDGIPYMGISQHMWRRDGLSYSHQDRCVIIDSKGLLSSVKCDEGYPFMCFKKFAHLTVTECGTTDPAYTLDKSTGSCYKLHREHEDWNTAVTVCTAEGGYLAIPSDASEAQLLAAMATDDETYIGYMNWEGTRISDKWHTLHGDSITYTQWADQDPFDIVSACGAIKKKSALLRKLPCRDRKPFICEKNITSLTIYPRNRIEEIEGTDENS